MKLDPARARRQTAFALAEGVFGRVQPAERHESPVTLARPGQHAVVGEAVGRLALRVVERENARATRLGGVELGEQLLQRQRAPVLVEAQVRMGIDDFRPGGAQLGDLGEKRGERLRVELGVHCLHPILSPWPGKS